MAFLLDLWLPILLSGVFVFIASSIFHMVLPFHRSDYKKMPGEEDVMKAIGNAGVVPGEYMFPCATDMKEYQTEAMQKKFIDGPVGHMTVLPSGPPNFGKPMIQWFAYNIGVGVLVAYTASFSLAQSAAFVDVFRLTATFTAVAYSLSYVPNSIWKGLNWMTTLKFVIDGLVYAVLTGLTFAWLW